jgi:hypothetical protein
MKVVYIIAGIVLSVLATAVLWSQSGASSDQIIIAQNGIHWHPQLTIYVKGEKIEIPQNIGLGVTHLPIHTHEDLPLIHLEFDGVVQEKDIMLGQFFKNWGRDIRSFGANMRMTVNGTENIEFENYIMKDGDKIELHYD